MWTTDHPTEPGTYWFYGDGMAGACGVDHTDRYKWEPRMSLVNVHRAGNGLIAVANGHFVNLRKFVRGQYGEGYLGYWQLATLPVAPPDWEDYSKSKESEPKEVGKHELSR